MAMDSTPTEGEVTTSWPKATFSSGMESPDSMEPVSISSMVAGL